MSWCNDTATLTQRESFTGIRKNHWKKQPLTKDTTTKAGCQN